MREYFLEYKPFLLFLAKFFVSYLVLTTIYQLYLNQFDEKNCEVDRFTEIVAEHSRKVLSLFDSGSYTLQNHKEPSVKLYYYNKWVARIIEGCNAISIMILFVSFVVAFTGKLKQTILFLFFGVIIIHVFNILRIAFLCIAIYKKPAYQHILHGVLFPLIIYGLVFFLWIIWVNKFSFYAKKNNERKV